MRTFVVIILVVLGLGVLAGTYFVVAGVSARPEPGALEASSSRLIRNLAIAVRTRRVANPVPVSDAVIKEGLEHFADHCASCHANDGSGKTQMGQGLSPRAPDMRLPATQNLSDAELFYIIENGIRLTGMPGWSTGTKAGETASWHLVHFIRHLPSLTEDEIGYMESLNPKSPEEVRQEIEAERFLRGETPATREPETHEQTHSGAHR